MTLVGCPFHGLWRSGLGLRLPTGRVKVIDPAPEGGSQAFADMPLTDSLRRRVHPAFGDCLVVKIPGLALPETPSRDLTAGLTWLNYAVISGANHLLYGKRLGRGKWIYIDPQNKPWFVTTRGQQLVFRAIKKNPVEIYVSPLMMRVIGVQKAEFFVLDANDTGSRVALGLGIWAIGFQGLERAVPLKIIGVPGLPGFSIVDDDEIIIPPGAMTRVYDDYNECYSAGLESGAVDAVRFYGAGDTVIDAVSVSSLAFTAQPPKRDGGSWAMAGELWLVVNGIKVLSVGVSAEFSRPAQSETFSVSVSIDGYKNYAFSGGSEQGLTYRPSIVLVRRTNKVWEAMLCEFDTAYSISTRSLKSLALITPAGFQLTGYLAPVSDADRYFTFHPVTGELVSSSEPVCFM